MLCYTCIYTTGYASFMNQLKKEMSMENLLFITIMIQWQDYLFDNKLINDDINDEIAPIYKLVCVPRIRLPKILPISPIVYHLPKMSHSGNTSVNSGGSSLSSTFQFSSMLRMESNSSVTDDINVNPDFSILSIPFEKIYKQYIEPNRAPLELNISAVQRNKIKSHYCEMQERKKITNMIAAQTDVKQKNCEIIEPHPWSTSKTNRVILNQTQFEHVWNDLIGVCDEVFIWLEC